MYNKLVIVLFALCLGVNVYASVADPDKQARRHHTTMCSLIVIMGLLYRVQQRLEKQ